MGWTTGPAGTPGSAEELNSILETKDIAEQIISCCTKAGLNFNLFVINVKLVIVVKNLKSLPPVRKKELRIIWRVDNSMQPARYQPYPMPTVGLLQQTAPHIGGETTAHPQYTTAGQLNQWQAHQHWQGNANNNCNVSEGYRQPFDAQQSYQVASRHQRLSLDLGHSLPYSQPRSHLFPHSGLRRRMMDSESASSPDIEASQESKVGDAKKRGVKKRRKKGANEPQKPVSAYALFFRDTQAAIKAENPSATFGEISKIVASMWDSLSEEAKQVYKQKTETAKRDYLKQLASFRANLISKGRTEGDEEDSQPLSMIKMKMNESLPPPPKLQMAPVARVADVGGDRAPADERSQAPPLPMKHIMLRPVSTSAPTPPPIQLRSIVPKAHSPVTFLQSTGGQVIKLLPASQVATLSGEGSDGKSRIIKMSDLMKPSEARHVQPILQTLAEEHDSSLHDNGHSEALLSSHEDYRTTSVRVCVRDGCGNQAVSDPQWNDEFCSSDCVFLHCRDVFDAWSSARQVSASGN